MSELNVETLGWDWRNFSGSKSALKWNRRDLPALHELIEMTPGRAVCLQAGGNLGIYPKYLARHFGVVLTFEPAPSLFPMLVRNAPELNIVRFQAALGDDHAGVTMSQQRRDGKDDNHEGITHVAGPGNIPTIRIDDLELKTLDLLCLDLEGWEIYALRGAMETLRRCRPVVSVEINKNAAFVGVDKDEVRAVLQRAGYHFVARRHSDEFWTQHEVAA